MFDQCDESYTEDNIIVILPTKEEDKQRLISRGAKLAEQGLTHSLKKAPGSKKRKKHATTEGSADPASDSAETKKSTAPSGNGIKNAATASLTARVLSEENEKKKRRKMMGLSDNLDSLFTKETKDGKKSGDFMTRGFSIPSSARR